MWLANKKNICCSRFSDVMCIFYQDASTHAEMKQIIAIK